MSHDASFARRDFLGAALASAGGLTLAGCAGHRVSPASERASLIGPGDLVLFQGDSITDASRDRERATEANLQSALGSGYAWLAGAGLLVQPAGETLRVFNRGISGNKVFQLADRWQRDCLDLEPDVVSILIGVNDFWHTKTNNYTGTAAIYERDYLALLQRTRIALPSVELVVCEPFMLRCGAVEASWIPEFAEYRMAAKRVAEQHGAVWVPFQSMFDSATAFAPPEHWAADGVHPSPAGASLMAQTWLDAVRAARSTPTS